MEEKRRKENFGDATHIILGLLKIPSKIYLTYILIVRIYTSEEK